jgi:hypothetical protein
LAMRTQEGLDLPRQTSRLAIGVTGVVTDRVDSQPRAVRTALPR